MNKIIGLYSNDPEQTELMIRDTLQAGYNQPVIYSRSDNHTYYTRQFKIVKANSVEEAQQLTIRRFGKRADFGIWDQPEKTQNKSAVASVSVDVKPQGEREDFACDVVIPYSQPNYDYLEDAVKSVLNQNFVKVTLHLINDGVKSDPIGEKYSRVENVRCYKNTDGPVGPYVTLNRLFDYLEHDCFANQDSDDISLPMRLYKSMKIIEQGYDIVGGSMEQFVTAGDDSDSMRSALTRKPYHHSGKPYYSSPSGCVVNSTAVIRKTAYEASNGMAPWTAGADSEFYERCILAGFKVAALQDVVALRRLHSPSLSNDQVTSGHGTCLRDEIRRMTAESIKRQRSGPDHTIGGLEKHRNDKQLIRIGGC